jgi:hypothetical protein
VVLASTARRENTEYIVKTINFLSNEDTQELAPGFFIIP